MQFMIKVTNAGKFSGDYPCLTNLAETNEIAKDMVVELAKKKIDAHIVVGYERVSFGIDESFIPLKRF